jgi:hypothetical protein
MNRRGLWDTVCDCRNNREVLQPSSRMAETFNCRIAETIQKPNGSLILQEVVFNPENSAKMIHKN